MTDEGHISKPMSAGKILALTAGGLTYLGLLVATRELGRAELDLVRRLAKRGR